MEVQSQVASRRDEILRLASEYGAGDVRVFGSVARGQTGPSSDLDLLVRLEQGRSLLDLIGLKQDLEDLLGIPVDVVTDASLSPYLRAAILSDAVPI